ncbi:MAG: hypothetical protein GYA59_10100, partial [Chloroflexi bacterium]|nr:hypothetical protein [Chloroflexota bacterium]
MPYRKLLPLLILLVLLCQACQPAVGPAAENSTAPAASAAVSTAPSSLPTPGSTPPAAEAVWVVNGVDQTLLAIDPGSNRLAAQIPLDAEPLALATGEGGVGLILQPKGQDRQLLRIDPTSHQAGAPIAIPQGEALTLATGGGWVWVGVAENTTSTGSDDYHLAGGIVRIDPASSQVVEYLPTRAVAAELVVADQTLWALEQMKAFTYLDRIEASSRTIVSLPQQAESLAYVHQFARIAANPAGVWATSANPSSRYIYHVDPADGRITHVIAVGDAPEATPLDLVATADAVWVALRGGTLARVNPATMTVESQVETGGEISGLFTAFDDLWVLRAPEALVTRIDARSGETIASISTGSRPRPTPTPSLRPPP